MSMSTTASMTDRSDHHSPGLPSAMTRPPCLRVCVTLRLGVLFGEVVLEGADWGCPFERSVGSVVIVEVDEPVVGCVALGV